MQYQRRYQFTPLLIAIAAAGMSLPATSMATEPNQTRVSSQRASVEHTTQTQALAEQQEIERQIKRIEAKLKTEPKEKGWVIVGDAYMYLKRYNEAVSAYQNAYLLSEDSKDVRAKIKRALNHAQVEQ